MPKQQRPFAPVRDGILEHHARMTWAEIAVYASLLNRVNRTARNGRVGLCAGLTGNKLAKEMRKSRGATHRALSGLAGVKGPHGKRGRYIEVLPDGIFVLNFDPAEKSAIRELEDASALGRIPAGQILAGQILAGSGQNLATSRPEYGRIRPDSGHPSLLRDVDVSEDVDDPCGASSAAVGPVYWDEANESLSIDEDWLRDEIESYQAEVGVTLTRAEYEHEAGRLRLELLRDTRLRACIKLAKSGKPSSASQFRRLATYTAGRFKEAIQKKGDRTKRSSSRPDAVEQAENYIRRGHDEVKADAKADKARIDACKRDHSSSSVRIKGADVWYCVGKCGWTERLPEELRWKSKR